TGAATTVIGTDQGYVQTDLDNYKSRYYCMSPLVNGIAMLGIAGMLNGTKAITKVCWSGDKSMIITPACTGTLLVYAKDPGTLQAFDCDGARLTLSTDGENPSLVHVPVSDRPIKLVIV
nr:hypothetical protein [Candidatus Sigynarchaeota archaeon]